MIILWIIGIFALIIVFSPNEVTAWDYDPASDNAIGTIFWGIVAFIIFAILSGK